MKKFRQKISEYVGQGHPDIIADKISNVVKTHAVFSATETIVNKNGVYISGETAFKNKTQKNKAKKEIKKLIDRIKKDYGYVGAIPITFNFVEQDAMLADRRKKLISGDQEIVYFHKLDKKDVHFHLREIDKQVSAITETYDYKILVNMKNKTANLSISTSHKEYLSVGKLIISELNDRFGEDIKINVCEFKGGSIFNDTGVTGRKLLVEKEGTGYPHGGGAYFGKDETKAAVWGYDRLVKWGKKNSVIVYFPGDDLNSPNYQGKVK